MPVGSNIFSELLITLAKDRRVTVWHMAALFAIAQLATCSDIAEPIFISRKKVMELAHINNFMTYHKCIRELQKLGYITYFPSYHPAIGSKVFLMKKQHPV